MEYLIEEHLKLNVDLVEDYFVRIENGLPIRCEICTILIILLDIFMSSLVVAIGKTYTENCHDSGLELEL